MTAWKPAPESIVDINKVDTNELYSACASDCVFIQINVSYNRVLPITAMSQKTDNRVS